MEWQPVMEDPAGGLEMKSGRGRRGGTERGEVREIHRANGGF